MYPVSGKGPPFSLFSFSVLCLKLFIGNCKILALSNSTSLYPLFLLQVSMDVAALCS